MTEEKLVVGNALVKVTLDRDASDLGNWERLDGRGLSREEKNYQHI